MKSDAAALAKIRELYDQLPVLQCLGRCANSCGPIDMSNVERARIADLGVTIPTWNAADGFAWERDNSLACPALSMFKTCRVYDDRPLICRLWGIAESLPCPHGCRPTRELPDDEALTLILDAMLIGGHPNYDDMTPELRQRMLELLHDDEVGPLMARFMRGDRTLEPQILQLIHARR